MTAAEVSAELARVRIEIEQHEAAVWCLERTRDELRQQLQALNAFPRIPPQDQHAAP